MLPESCLFSQLVNTDTFICEQIRYTFIADEVQGANDDQVVPIIV